MCTFPYASNRCLKNTRHEQHASVIDPLGDSMFFDPSPQKRRPKLRKKGPFWEPIFRIGLPKFPKAPFRPKKWAHKGPIPSSGGAQRLIACRPPCVHLLHPCKKSGPHTIVHEHIPIRFIDWILSNLSTSVPHVEHILRIM